MNHQENIQTFVQAIVVAAGRPLQSQRCMDSIKSVIDEIIGDIFFNVRVIAQHGYRNIITLSDILEAIRIFVSKSIPTVHLIGFGFNETTDEDAEASVPSSSSSEEDSEASSSIDLKTEAVCIVESNVSSPLAIASNLSSFCDSNQSIMSMAGSVETFPWLVTEDAASVVSLSSEIKQHDSVFLKILFNHLSLHELGYSIKREALSAFESFVIDQSTLLLQGSRQW